MDLSAWLSQRVVARFGAFILIKGYDIFISCYFKFSVANFHSVSGNQKSLVRGLIENRALKMAQGNFIALQHFIFYSLARK